MATVGYARVSKEEQADTLPAQVARLQAAGCDRIITDVESGRNSDRDGLAEVMELVKHGGVTELLVTRIDRLGRDAAYADALLATCQARDVTVRALDGGAVETATPQGWLMARLQTGLADMESQMLSLRLRRQFTVYRAQGRHLRRRKPFGYRGGADHKLEPDPEQWPQALQVLQKLREHGSFYATSYELPSWCSWTPAPTSLQMWFCNPVIRGHIGHHWDRTSGKGWNQRWGEIHYDQHPALISEADWRDLASVLQRPRNLFVGGEARHGMTGLLRCASCGHLLRRNTAQGVAWWRCRHRLCTARAGVKEDKALQVVVKACVKEARRLAAALSAPESPDPAMAALQVELEQMERLAARNPNNRAMAAAVNEQRQQLEALRRSDPPPADPAKLEAMSDLGFYLLASPEQQRTVFQSVLRSVSVGVGGDPIEPLPRR
jgi:DNA invertase Pin-like site-specific DNA recombinase